MEWNFLLIIYESGWDKLAANKNKNSFKQCVFVQFNRKLSNNIPVKSLLTNKSVKDKQANISRIPLSISPKPSKNILAKSKFYKKNQILTLNFQLNKYLYTQASKSNVKDIVKIKNIFPKLSANKVSEIHKVINNSSQKDKPRLNITTKDLLRNNDIFS